LIPRQIGDAGILSALTLNIQGAQSFDGIEYAALKNHPTAKSDIRTKPFPSY
jgi:hypothetical protein